MPDPAAATVVSRPSSSSTSNRPGLAARPVTATRVAWIRAAAFSTSLGRERAQRLLERVAVKGSSRSKPSASSAETAPRSSGFDRCFFDRRRRRNRPGQSEGTGARSSTNWSSFLSAAYRVDHAQRTTRASPVVKASRHRPCSRARLETPGELVGRQPGNVLLVEPVELFGVEDGVAAADAFERERCDQLVAREQFLVAARRPSEQRQEVDHRLGQISRDAGYSMTDVAPCRLLSRFLSGPRISGTCANGGGVLPKRLIQQHLLRRVGDVIVAADDVGDLHVDVVGDDRQVIGRLAVGPQNDEVLDLGVVELDRPVDEIVEAPSRPAAP